MVIARGDPHFIGRLQFEADPQNDWIKVLTAPLSFVDSRGEQVTSDVGLRTDGVSTQIPLSLPVIGELTRFVMWGDEFDGPFLWSGVIHDGEYAKATDVTFCGAFFSRSRAAADRRFFESARAQYTVIDGKRVDRIHRASWWRAGVAHLFLRLFGASAWMNDARKNASKH